MKYWICRKCKSENTPGSTICWKCSLAKDYNEDCFSQTNAKEHCRQQHKQYQYRPIDPIKSLSENYWICHKCKEQVFYLVQVCPVCFTRKPEDACNKADSGSSSTQIDNNEKIICTCLECGLKIRIQFLPGKHELKCPGCHQEYDVFVINDRSIHLVKKFQATEECRTRPLWHKVLEVRPDSSDEEIKNAYRKLMKEYHPDKVANLGKELRDLAEKKAKEISEAYENAIGKRNK